MTETPPFMPAGPQNSASPHLLEIADVTMRFGGIVALDAVTFAVDQGGIVGLIGPNGAGKTTLFNCLSRLYRQVRGDIRLNGQSLRRCAPSDIAALGVGRTFQAPTLFASMSVLDNVKVGSHSRGRNVRGRATAQRLPVQPDVAAHLPIKPAQAVEQCSLAGAVWAD